MGEDIKLWNFSWLKKIFTPRASIVSVVHSETLKNVTPVITFRETRLYNEQGPQG